MIFKKLLSFLIIAILLGSVLPYSILPVHAQVSKPVISSVSEITAATTQTIIISGSGFGNIPPKTDPAFDGSPLTAGCNVNTPYLDIRDTAGASDTWEAGKEDCNVSDKIGIYIQSWTDSRIILTGFGSELYVGGVSGQFNIANGDPITIEVYGPSNSGMASYQTRVGVQPTPTTNPVTQQGNEPMITSVTPITTNNQQTIKIMGQGFGTNPTAVKNSGNPNDGSIITERPGTPCHVSTPSLMITDNSQGWNAGDTDCTGGDWIGVYLTNWTDNEIDLSGFGSELGSGGLWRIANGDSITITVFGPNNDGKGTYNLIISPGNSGQSKSNSGNTGQTTSGTTTSSMSQIIIPLVPSGMSQQYTWDESTPTQYFSSGYVNIGDDLWNIAPNSQGTVTMKEDQTGLYTNVDFSSVNYNNIMGGVVGYPNVSYGNSLFGSAATQMSQDLTFPMQIKNLPQLVSLADYSIDQTSTPVDFAYDIWVTQSPNATSPTTGDLELMIWTYYSNNAMLPPGTPVSTVPISTLVNGVSEQLDWNVYVDYSSTSWTKVYIVPTNPISSGKMGVDMYQMISEMVGSVIKNYPQQWNISKLQNYWLRQISLGSEFKTSTNLISPQVSYSWNLSDYCFITNGQPLDTGVVGLSCSNGNQQTMNPSLSTNSKNGIPSQTQPQSLTSINVGTNPNGIALATSNNNVYVANSGSNTVSVISGTNNNVITTINVGTNPGAVAYDPANQDIYVSNDGSNDISVIRTSDNTVVATIPMNTCSCRFAYDPVNQDMYIANAGNSPGPSNAVSVISSTTNTVVSTITVDPNPIRLAFDPSNNDIYVDNYASGEVTVIDGTSNTVTKTINVGANPNTIGYDPANNDMYVTSNNSDNVFVISGTTNNVIATLNVGTNPFGVFYDPANQEMFVSSTVGNTVSAIRDTAIVSTVNVGTAPYNIIFNPTDNDMYVLNTAAISGGTSSISVIGSTNTVVATLTVGTNPDHSTFDPSNNDIYVSNTGSGTVSVIPPQAMGGGQPSETVMPQQSAQSLPSSTQTTPYAPTTNNVLTISSPAIMPQSTSLQLPPGQQMYIFGMGTGGAYPSSDFVNDQFADVTDNAGQISAALAYGTSNTNSYTTSTGFHTIGGVAVSGFSSVSASYNKNNTPGAPSVSDTFSVTVPNSLVVVMALDSSETYLNVSGLPGLQFDKSYTNTPGVIPMIISHTYLDAGTYTVTENTSPDPGQTLPMEADLIGVFVFSPSSSSSSMGTLSSTVQNTPSQNSLPSPVIMAPASETSNLADLTISPTVTQNNVLGGNDLVLTISNPSSQYVLLDQEHQIQPFIDKLLGQINTQQIQPLDSNFAFFLAAGGKGTTSSNFASIVDDLSNISQSQISGLGLATLSSSGYAGYIVPTSSVINSNTVGTTTISDFTQQCMSSLFNADNPSDIALPCIQYALDTADLGTTLGLTVDIGQLNDESYTPQIVVPPNSSLYVDLVGLEPSNTLAYNLNEMLQYASYAPSKSIMQPNGMPEPGQQYTPASYSASVGPFTLTHYTYSVIFTESGLQPATHAWWCFWCSDLIPSWSGILDGNQPSSSTPTSITFNNVNPGQHTYSITSPTGYTTSSATGTIQVSGNTNQAITFSQN